MEFKWAMFHNAIVEAAAWCCGCKYAGASRANRVREQPGRHVLWRMQSEGRRRWTVLSLGLRLLRQLSNFTAAATQRWIKFQCSWWFGENHFPQPPWEDVQQMRVCLLNLWIQEEQCGFCDGPGTLDQLNTVTRVLEASWAFTSPFYMYFIDLEKNF